MTQLLGPAYELGTSNAKASRSLWLVVTAAAVVAAISMSFAWVMFDTSSRLVESEQVADEWPIAWTGSMEEPWVEQQEQVHALRSVAGGGAVLVGVLALLIASSLWRQRLEQRRAEYRLHWSVGATKRQSIARLAGEGRLWAASALALTLGGGEVVLVLLERTFPGQAALSPAQAVSAIALTAVAIVMIRWEGSAGATSPTDKALIWDLVASPPAIGATGFAVLCGVGLLWLHAPFVRYTDSEAPRSVTAVSFAQSPVGTRESTIVAVTDRARAAGWDVGLASRGTVRGTGPTDVATVECGRCYEGGLPMPLKFVRAEIHAVSPDTFPHLGIMVWRGRDFDQELDRVEPNVAIVSRSLAGRHFERGEAIGRRIMVGASEWRTVVGIVDDRSDARAAEYAVYLPLAQVQLPNAELIASRDPAGLTQLLPADVALGASMSFAEVFAVHVWFRTVLGWLGTLALVLLVLGMSISARNDVRAIQYEIAVRRAVGARRRDVWRFLGGLLTRRLAIALIGGAWLSLFLGAALVQAYGSIPQVDWAVWLVAGATVAAAYLLGTTSCLARSAERGISLELSEESPA